MRSCVCFLLYSAPGYLFSVSDKQLSTRGIKPSHLLLFFLRNGLFLDPLQTPTSHSMVVVTLKKTTRIAVLCLTVIVAYSMLLALNPMKSLAQRYHKLVYLNLRILYFKYMSADLKLDTSSSFQQTLDEVSTEKLGDNTSPDNFFINPNYIPETTLPIPSYYGTDDKPLIQPFDPRFTLAAYYHWIRANPDKPVPFHWSDWVDLKDLNKYILLPEKTKPNCTEVYDISKQKKVLKGSVARPVEQYCHDDSLFPLGWRISQFPHAQTRENMRMLGKSFLYSGFPSPTKLIFLTNDAGSYVVDVEDHENNNYRNSVLFNGMVEDIMTELDGRSFDVLKAYNQLVESRPPTNADGVMRDSVIHLDQDMFHVDAKEVIDELQRMEHKSVMDKKYLECLLDSTGTSTPVKYFDEAKLVNSDSSKIFGEHHDWRFFDGLTINSDRQVLVLHRLIKNYLQFCKTHGLVTWIAHGSLLSWYWNGMAFPWDADTDAQMPIRDLHRLGREFNQTLVVENVGVDGVGDETSFNGMGSFFVDVGSSITHRERGNGMNNIDARFIDVSTGLYVDITGLALSNETAPSRYDYKINLDKNKKKLSSQSKLTFADNALKQVYNCRNRHFSSLQELSPLIVLGVQNQLGYVPLNFGLLLDQEYKVKGFLQTNFQDYYYLRNLRIWVNNKIVTEYVRNKGKFIEDNSVKKEKRVVSEDDAKVIEKLNLDDHKNLIKHEWIFREYILTRDFTAFHEEQMKHLLRNRMEQYIEGVNHFSNSNTVNHPLWADTFMHHIHVDKIRYEEEVDKLLELSNAYKDEVKKEEVEAQKESERAREKEEAEKQKQEEEAAKQNQDTNAEEANDDAKEELVPISDDSDVTPDTSAEEARAEEVSQDEVPIEGAPKEEVQAEQAPAAQDVPNEAPQEPPQEAHYE